MLDTRSLLDGEDIDDDSPLIVKEKNFVLPLMLLGGVIVLVLLAMSFFMPAGSWVL